MTNTTNTDVMVSADSPPSEETDATVLTSLESLIKEHIKTIDTNRKELKKVREMLASTLTNDETYKLHEEEAKKAAKVKAATKQELLKLAENRLLADKAQELTSQIKESDEALSEYLREYQRISGSNEFETDDGEVREIVYVAKLVKKSSWAR
ncbi:hypothetical protein A2973_03440 [Candidatus Gottesmanbacteria bacterium RIFCSPLOWO2_01_FULL_49_10]|uniref:Nucleotide exchange factor GrpE n=1 Tax=Candidatus Gottesmanbacteria bacterium RIFCSPLOWO2_01_FULL_49_10 TaxID=1798396 RepID=A0A1F6AVM2_9BACT|nr:MAG: hypothetical protein UY10_C0008G0006 [Microgenomates group bacterium GW2011_GWA2_47_8]OGG28754.1 MAG: hypothetical protein A2973_03440 [Candidatus Gottesmanbacteria bacterium RIFCSPLOWO2_01_FULL_49_10]